MRHAGIVTLHQNAVMANLDSRYMVHVQEIEKEMRVGDWAAANNSVRILEAQLTEERYAKLQ